MLAASATCGSIRHVVVGSDAGSIRHEASATCPADPIKGIFAFRFLLFLSLTLFEIVSTMPSLTVDGIGTFEVPEGKRLAAALCEEAGTDQLHACGGKARCTTCRVEFISGEPDSMTVAEKQVLAAKGASGVRLSCQILCESDMSVRVISRLEGSGRKDSGSPLAGTIEPTPVEWTTKG